MTARRLGRSRAGTDAAAFLPSSRLVPSAARPRRVARNLVLAFAALVVLLSLAPWQQNLPGDGQVIAYSPDERPQAIAATISGRIARWHVVEGQEVEEGELLVELVDNDPMRLERMEIEREAAQARLTAYEEKVQAYRDRLEALRRSQQAQISAAEAEVRIAQQSLRSRQEMMAAAEASDATAQIQRRRVDGLAGEGLASQRDRELAEALVDERDRVARLGARPASGRRGFGGEQARAYLERTRAYASGASEARRPCCARPRPGSSRHVGRSCPSSRASRSSAPEVRAPRAGIIDRVIVQQGGIQGLARTDPREPRALRNVARSNHSRQERRGVDRPVRNV
ncbi:MAG: biotin/lipoyl-binding protein [Polyangiales bacterium]